MGLIGGTLGYRLLRSISADGETGYCDGSAYQSRSKLEVLLGSRIWSEIAGKFVIDFGCGAGVEAVELSRSAARERSSVSRSEKASSPKREDAPNAKTFPIAACLRRETAEKADIILSLDSFEHFDDPAQVLRTMRRLLKDDGTAIIAFGHALVSPAWRASLFGLSVGTPHIHRALL